MLSLEMEFISLGWYGLMWDMTLYQINPENKEPIQGAGMGWGGRQKKTKMKKKKTKMTMTKKMKKRKRKGKMLNSEELELTDLWVRQ